MSKHELPKTYDYTKTESRIYQMWESKGYFEPTNKPINPDHDPDIKPFVISIPPANVTGELHIGHALFVSMEDLMIRYHRMKGIPTLWVPGTDHAGIATQLQVEKDLMKTEGKRREDIGREAFVKRTWDWKEKYGSIITNQIRRLGASCSWSYERFTLDNGLSVAVREAFVRLYEKGMIYRGPRLINWSPGLQTAVSDLEVEYFEEPGKLYFFKYMLKDSEEFIPVATTRPETILGDTAVAVHPEDERYKDMIGKSAIVPMLGREIPVIGDEYVDREFGTGALKITPGHDINDYEIGLRHKLPIISILNKDASINEHGGQYESQSREECREKLWSDMKSAGLVIKEEDYIHKIPRSQRGGEIIEPMISTQWFVKIDSMAKAALDAVKDGSIQIVPEFFTKVYYNWLENIQDWCISRQLWWGHRIPVWYGPDGEMFCARSEEEALAQAKQHYGKETALEQDPDVLDTWFSSGLWPFSTLGWPEETPDLAYFYPTSVLETGYDILFFWVARMIMSGLEYTGEKPFDTVYLHGIIRDEIGRKMSKTTGNVIDPLEVMDELGTDALRFTLLVGSSPGKDMNLSIKKVESNRNFANKLWNASRLVLGLLDQSPSEGDLNEIDWTLADSWIWARLRQLTHDVDRLFTAYQYGEAGRQIYDFFWSEFADWYLEIAKVQVAEGGLRARKTAQALVQVLDKILRMLHPFTPFVTEELWGRLKEATQDHSPAMCPKEGWEEALIIASWPDPTPFEGWEEEVIFRFTTSTFSTVSRIRNLRAENDIQPGTKISDSIIASPDHHEDINTQLPYITKLAHLDFNSTSVLDSDFSGDTDGMLIDVIPSGVFYAPLSGLFDIEHKRSRLLSDSDEVNSQITRLEKLLASPFAEKAPQEVVQKEKDKLVEYLRTAERLKNELDELG